MVKGPFSSYPSFSLSGTQTWLKYREPPSENKNNQNEMTSRLAPGPRQTGRDEKRSGTRAVFGDEKFKSVVWKTCNDRSEVYEMKSEIDCNDCELRDVPTNFS